VEIVGGLANQKIEMRSRIFGKNTMSKMTPRDLIIRQGEDDAGSVLANYNISPEERIRAAHAILEAAIKEADALAPVPVVNMPKPHPHRDRSGSFSTRTVLVGRDESPEQVHTKNSVKHHADDMFYVRVIRKTHLHLGL
jgi:hypothetical protein